MLLPLGVRKRDWRELTVEERPRVEEDADVAKMRKEHDEVSNNVTTDPTPLAVIDDVCPFLRQVGAELKKKYGTSDDAKLPRSDPKVVRHANLNNRLKTLRATKADVVLDQLDEGKKSAMRSADFAAVFAPTLTTAPPATTAPANVSPAATAPKTLSELLDAHGSYPTNQAAVDAIQAVYAQYLRAQARQERRGIAACNRQGQAFLCRGSP